MSNHQLSLQDDYLTSACEDKVRVSVYLINGIKLSGIVTSFDHCVIVLSDGENIVNQLIYKHAISTIVPAKGLQVNYGKKSISS